MAPPASCIVPIGEELLIAGLERRFKNAFYVSSTRPPSVYRGNPFVVEVGLAYGGDMQADEPAEIMRFANRVPLQYQPKACAISEAIYDTNWRKYGLAQPKGSLPVGPLAIVVHLASVWVPFTSEAKEAVAHYDDLLREMKLAVQECGRKLGAHLRAHEKAESEHKRLTLFQRYIPEVSAAIGSILGTPKDLVETAFAQALPNFVRTLEKTDTEADGAERSDPPPPRRRDRASRRASWSKGNADHPSAAARLRGSAAAERAHGLAGQAREGAQEEERPARPHPGLTGASAMAARKKPVDSTVKRSPTDEGHARQDSSVSPRGPCAR